MLLRKWRFANDAQGLIGDARHMTFLRQFTNNGAAPARGRLIVLPIADQKILLRPRNVRWQRRHVGLVFEIDPREFS